jgi:ATP-binding cassette subfamily B multidrug efflux pump
LSTNPLVRVLQFLRTYRKDTVLSILLLITSVAVELATPSLIQSIIDQGIAAKDTALIATTTALILLLAVLEAAATIGNTFFAVRVAQSIAADLRLSLFSKIEKFSFGNLDRFQTGQLVVRLTSDVNIIQMMITMGLRMFIRAPLLIGGSIFLIVATNLELARTVLLLLPLTLILAAAFVWKAEPLFLEVQKRLDKLNTVLQENLAGVRVVKAFVRMDREAERFGKANEDLTAQAIKVVTLFSVLFPTMLLIVNLSILSVIWFGGLQAIAGRFTVGEIIAFTNYLLLGIFPLLFLAIIAGQASAATASAQRIYDVIDSDPQVKNRPDARPLGDVKGRVRFEGVCFSYSGNCAEPVLNDINLTAEPGQTVAILGATGSGKSSLVNLIPRFYDVQRGRVTIDGVDVRDVTLESLRSIVGIALQEAILFTGTIKDNIRYGRPEATDDEVIEAAKAAQAHDFIIALPKGYDADVGQRGVNLSGGQKQRISIARALLVKPTILILDDSTSSVDVETEARIQEQLEKRMGDRTSFIIAQRISTVLKADKIVVLDKGMVVAEGTHAELMKGSPIYKEIYDSQLGDGGSRQ